MTATLRRVVECSVERERVGVDDAGGDGREVEGEEGAGRGARSAVDGAVDGALAAHVSGELHEQADAARPDPRRQWSPC